MYIVAIAWLYVVFMMSITEQSVTAGIMTFFLYGVFPLTIVLYLMGTPQRKRNRQIREKSEAAHAAAQSPENEAVQDQKTTPDTQ
jgi:ABC-type lipoprotein release transport system permease subunit